jgi:hypothetical protein
MLLGVMESTTPPSRRRSEQRHSIEVPRDPMGWPLAFWELAGGAPGFDVGRRPRRHERGDVLARRPRRAKQR